MPTFTPPKSDGQPWGDVDSDAPSNRLMRYYGAVPTGTTVWHDGTGYKSSQYPFLGGQRSRSFNDGDLIQDVAGPAGLLEATEVYLGGHTYPITEAKATQLMAAGFQVGGHIDSQEQKWVDYGIASEISRGHKGGDGSASMRRPDNLSLWVFADTIVGTVDANGFYVNGLPVRNSCVVQNSSGVIINQVYAAGGASAAWNHPEAPTKWWWAIDITGNNDGTASGEDVVIVCWEVTNGGNFGHLIQTTLLTLNVFAEVATVTNIPTPGNNFFAQAVYRDTSFYYILGIEYDVSRGGYDNYSLSTQTFSRLARAPFNNLTVPASWEYWTGLAWSPNQSQAIRLTDWAGNAIEGNADITKVGSTYIMAAASTTDEAMRLYSAPAITGPWRYYHTEDSPKPPQAGPSPRSGLNFAYYLPKFHEYLNPNSTNMVLTYNRNTFQTSTSVAVPDDPVHVSTFMPLFIYLPTPT